MCTRYCYFCTSGRILKILEDSVLPYGWYLCKLLTVLLAQLLLLLLLGHILSIINFWGEVWETTAFLQRRVRQRIWGRDLSQESSKGSCLVAYPDSKLHQSHIPTLWRVLLPDSTRILSGKDTYNLYLLPDIEIIDTHQRNPCKQIYLGQFAICIHIFDWEYPLEKGLANHSSILV